MENIEDKENDIFHYVYFIESHDIFRNIKISLTEEISESKCLEVIYKTEITNKKATFSINIYRFKFFPNLIINKNIQPDKFEVEIILEEDNKKYITKINNLDFEHDNYLYNFKLDIESESDIFNISHDKLDLSYNQQFDLYLNVLSKKELSENKKEKDDFIYSTLKLLIDNNKGTKNNKNIIKNEKYDFLFFISLFIESYESQYLPKLIQIFKPENIEDFGVPEQKLLIFVDILDKIENNKLIIFENEQNKEELISNFYTIRLLINFQFYKEKVNQMFNNENIKSIYIKY
jgi:hypothetical protein